MLVSQFCKPLYGQPVNDILKYILLESILVKSGINIWVMAK